MSLVPTLWSRPSPPRPCALPTLDCHLHGGGGAGGGSGLRGTAVSVAVTETAALQTQLGHRVVGTGRVVAPLGHGGQPGEVDSQVCDHSQL